MSVHCVTANKYLRLRVNIKEHVDYVKKNQLKMY